METIGLRWKNTFSVHLFPLRWSSRQKNTQGRDDIYSTRLFSHYTPRNALKLLWQMARTSFFYSQQEESVHPSSSPDLLPNWVITPDHSTVTLERELPTMTSPRKIRHERNKLYNLLYMPSPPLLCVGKSMYSMDPRNGSVVAI